MGDTVDVLVRAEGLRRSYGDRVAVDDVSLTIAPGETYGLLGPNGAGKTTTIGMVVGLLRPDSGRVEVDGRTMSPTAADAKRVVGYVPQQIALYPDLTARENLRFLGRLHRVEDLDARIAEVLDVVGLAGRADDRVDTYSGGMQRRCNIAAGLLHRPRLLVLDEPTVGVDPQSRDQILGAVARLADDGMSVLYTTHYMEEAERLCDRVGIIDGGRLVAEGSRRELVSLVGEDDVVRLDLDGDADEAADRVGALEGVTSVRRDGERLEVACLGAARRLPALLSAVAAAGVATRSVEVVEPDLEAVFLHVTGRALRDD